MQEIATMLDLKTTTDALGTTSFLKGYYSTGDGGEGIFYWVSSSVAIDNGGTIVGDPSLSGRWFRMFKDEIHVKWFGARGNSLMFFDVSVSLDPVTNSYLLISTSGAFDSSIIAGQPITISGADTISSLLSTTVASYDSSSQLTLTSVPTTKTVAGNNVAVIYCNDDTNAINSAILFASTYTGTNQPKVLLNTGIYRLCETAYINLYTNTYIQGASQSGSVIICNNVISNSSRPDMAATGTFQAATTPTTSVFNITLKNFSIYNLNIFDIERVENIMIDGLQAIDSFATAIYVNSSKNIVVQNCFINFNSHCNKPFPSSDCKKMGIRVEAANKTEDGASNILVTNNIVQNAQDNAIAVRAIGNNLSQSIVTSNRIFNAGKAAIKNTIEVNSSYNIKIGTNVIANNVIHGWAALVNEYAIDASNFQTSPQTDPPTPPPIVNPVYNVSITGNTIRSYTPLDSMGNKIYNPKQTGYINGNQLINGCITGNSCLGGVAKSGIQTYTSSEITISGNSIEDASQGGDVVDIANSGGIMINNSQYVNVIGNTVKNTGNSDVTPPINQPGIFLREASNCIVNGNICYDDATIHTQNYGIRENSSYDNRIGNNASLGNKNPNAYSKDSIVYDSMAVIKVLASKTGIIMPPHTTFLVLPDYPGPPPSPAIPRPLTLPIPQHTPPMANIFDYAQLTVWNQNTNTGKEWVLTADTVVTADNQPILSTLALPHAAILNFRYNWNIGKWVMWQ
jgi:hypothetical protein